MTSALRKSPFSCRMFSRAGCGRRQGSAINSLRSALTAALAGPTDSKMQAKGGPESRRCASDILTIKLVQNIGQVSPLRSSPPRMSQFTKYRLAGPFEMRSVSTTLKCTSRNWPGHVMVALRSST
jgi:hypothetical protein